MSALTQRFSQHPAYTPNNLPVDLARQLIVDAVTALTDSERLPISQLLGRVLAEAVISPVHVPAHDNSAMDGYALRHADLSAAAETTLTVIGSAYAGQPFTGTLNPGEAVRIMTGATLPAGADTVVMQEATRRTGATVTIAPGQHSGQHIRRAGEDLRAGLPALAAGKLIRPAELGLIASVGIGEATVLRRPRVAFFSTGNELAGIGHSLGLGQIYDSNRYTLFGMLSRLGVEVIDLGLVPDDADELESTMREAASIADAIVTSGGVSAGDADFTREAMGRLGEVVFWKLAMKPGRPFAFGRLNGSTAGSHAWLFGLPGNPVATMVAFYQFVRPALLKLSGCSAALAVPQFSVPCANAIRKAPGRTEFLRGVLFQQDGQWQVRCSGAQGSGILSSMSDANCLIVLGEQQGNVEAGAAVAVQVMDGLV